MTTFTLDATGSYRLLSQGSRSTSLTGTRKLRYPTPCAGRFGICMFYVSLLAFLHIAQWLRACAVARPTVSKISRVTEVRPHAKWIGSLNTTISDPSG